LTLASPLASPAATRAALQRFGLSTRKSFGQHFLVDDGIIGKILRLAAPDESLPVVEVGPGIGTLSYALLAVGARLLAIEADVGLSPALDEVAAQYPEQFSCLLQDALLLTPADLPDGFQRFALVANLPYAVAATLILDYFQKFSGLVSATVMVQREVAERILAKPGTKDYGAYTVKLSLLAEANMGFVVRPQSFWPPPRVDSAVIRIDRRAVDDGCESPLRAVTGSLAQAATHQPPRPDISRLVVDAAFAERRKTLRNSLISSLAKWGLSPERIDQALDMADIDGRRRGETLNLEEFRRLIATDLLKP